MEEWKDIQGYEGRYQISNTGFVKSLNYHSTKKPAILTPEINRGYKRVAFSKHGKVKRFLVHQLIAKAFIPNPHNKPHINHINGVHGDNRIENLEWCTPKENEMHSYRVLGKVCQGRKLSMNDVEFIKQNAVVGNPRLGGKRKSGNIKPLAEKFGVTVNVIHYVLKGRTYATPGLSN